ncbi:hypothetical protein HMPREF0758_0592 [Serratia odorifera DSM 4582]|uniref:Uncharacterized protein n=1 Tax=Serratia odorifera DSM 4582 TaxID=667129 RepID=D4DXE2_SEROD|nr:hypothetical protein HMPREF0758_0592 [Serratia odorifera DSM 4582]
MIDCNIVVWPFYVLIYGFCAGLIAQPGHWTVNTQKQEII